MPTLNSIFTGGQDYAGITGASDTAQSVAGGAKEKFAGFLDKVKNMKANGSQAETSAQAGSGLTALQQAVLDNPQNESVIKRLKDLKPPERRSTAGTRATILTGAKGLS